jgi:hypothetical protein
MDIGNLTVRAARDQYFATTAFQRPATPPLGELKMGPIPLGFPNSKARRRAVPLHDLHHLATGYATN